MGDEKTNDGNNRHAASTARCFMPGVHAKSYVKEIQLIQPQTREGKESDKSSLNKKKFLSKMRMKED